MIERVALPQVEIARMFDVSENTLRAWRRAGCPVASEKGRSVLMDPAAVLRWREIEIAAAAKGDIGRMDMDEARRRKLAAEAALAEIELARAKGEVVSVDLVAEEVGAALSALRSRLLAIPPAVSPSIELVEGTAAVREVLDAAIHEALDEISGGGFLGGAE